MSEKRSALPYSDRIPVTHPPTSPPVQLQKVDGKTVLPLAKGTIKIKPDSTKPPVCFVLARVYSDTDEHCHPTAGDPALRVCLADSGEPDFLWEFSVARGNPLEVGAPAPRTAEEAADANFCPTYYLHVWTLYPGESAYDHTVRSFGGEAPPA